MNLRDTRGERVLIVDEMGATHQIVADDEFRAISILCVSIGTTPVLREKWWAAVKGKSLDDQLDTISREGLIKHHDNLTAEISEMWKRGTPKSQWYPKQEIADKIRAYLFPR